MACTWSAAPADLPALRPLRDHVARHPTLGSAAVRLALACPAGFTAPLQRVAEAEGVVLLDGEALLP